jgi:hypothetical protein
MSGEELEKVKWRLELFEKYVLDLRDAFDAHRERYGALAQSVEEDFATWKNNILVFVSLGASIILALSPSGLNYLSKEYALGLLLPFLVVGLTVFLLVYTSKKRIHDYILKMDASFFSGKGKISYFRGYVLSQSLKLDRIDERRIDFYYRFTSIVAGAVALELQYKFEKMLKHSSVVLGSKPFQKIKIELDDGIQTMTSEVNSGKQVYRDWNTLWAHSYAEDMEVFTIIFKDFIEYSLNQNKTARDKDSRQQQNK